MIEKQYLTKADAALYLGVSVSTVERMMKSGELPFLKFSMGTVRIAKDALAELVTKSQH